MSASSISRRFAKMNVSLNGGGNSHGNGNGSSNVSSNSHANANGNGGVAAVAGVAGGRTMRSTRMRTNNHQPAHQPATPATGGGSVITETLTYSAPPNKAALLEKAYLPVPPASAPSNASNASSNNSSCASCNICFAPLSTQASVQLKTCSHSFHKACIHAPLSCTSNCPVCSAPVIEASAECPSGTMSVSVKPGEVPGFPTNTQTIQIMYTISGGTQKDYNDKPGAPHSGTSRTAYVPTTREGLDLLARLKFCWLAGLTFKVGTSQTSGRSNVVVWAGIPHKTGLQGGSFGYPDPTYLQQCHDAMDRLHIPDARSCQQQQQQQQAMTVPTVPVHVNLPSSSSSTLPTVRHAASAPSTRSRTRARTRRHVPGAHSTSAFATIPQGSASITTQTHATSMMFGFSAPAMTSNQTVQTEHIRYDAPQTLAQGVSIASALQCISVRSCKKSKKRSRPSLSSPDNGSSSSKAPSHQAPATSNEEKKQDDEDEEEDCVICLCPLSDGPQVAIAKCGHVFHDECIQECLNKEPRCPICRMTVGEPQGRSPSGTMSIHVIQAACPGFRNTHETIQIDYSMPSGTQRQFHDNPGARYSGTSRTAYLPHNNEGKNLLKRLKYAWTHGLTFRVGTSLTTGAQNVITWTSIHHKTTLGGGVHGFPDNAYIGNCNESLDALGVPDANHCF